MSEEITGRTVLYQYDPLNPTRSSEEAKARLHAIRDEDIDLSDIPEQSELSGWNRPGLLGGPVGKLRREAIKEKLLLVDEDVVNFFKGDGDDSAERMNAVLREYVETHRKSAC